MRSTEISVSTLGEGIVANTLALYIIFQNILDMGK